MINFRNSLKIWLSKDLWCSHNKQKNLPQCVYKNHKHYSYKINYYITSKKFCKLFDTIRQAKKVSQVGGASKNSTSPLYHETSKDEHSLDKMKAINYSKIAKRSHAYKGYARTNEVDILSSFNPKLHVSDTESTIRGELKNLLTELKEF